MTFVRLYGFLIHANALKNDAKFVKTDASLHPIPIKYGTGQESSRSE